MTDNETREQRENINVALTPDDVASLREVLSRYVEDARQGLDLIKSTQRGRRTYDANDPVAVEKAYRGDFGPVKPTEEETRDAEKLQKHIKAFEELLEKIK